MAGRQPFDDNPFAAPQSDIAPERYAPADVATTFATFWQRFAASFVDGILVQLVALGIGFAIGAAAGMLGLAGNGSPEADAALEAVGGLSGILTFFLYYALQESAEAQATLGKRLVGLRVTDLEGRRITFGRALLRTFCKLLSYFTLLIGFLIQPFTRRKQALHDLLAGTLVLKV